MNRHLNIAIPALLFLFLMVMLPSLPGMGYDVGKFREWALYMNQNGFSNAYGNTDYMPLFQYFLWLYIKVMGTEQAIASQIHNLRSITLIFDFIGIWYVFKWIDKKVAYYVILAISMLNIGYSYNSLIWGQVDGILSVLVFLTVYYGYKGNNMLSTIFLVLAFNFKVQSIIIVPVWGLLFINNLLGNAKLKTMLLPVLAAVGVQLILVFPFTLGRYGIKEIVSIVTNSFHVYQSISVKAANMWHWLVPDKNLLYASDAEVWIMGLTYKQVGLLLFFTGSFFALLPFMALLYRARRAANNLYRPNKELIWLTCALLYLLFYFFNTEIHERYCQPAFIFITAYAFFSGKFISYALFSIMYFFTLEISIGHLRLPNYGTLIFDFRFLAAINAVLIIYLSLNIYKQYRLALHMAATG